MKALLFALSLILGPLAYSSENPAEVSSAAAAIASFDESTAVRLLNIWATWCAPCVAEMKDLEDLHRKYRDKGLQVVGISMDDVLPGEREKTKKKVVQFLEMKSITFTNVYYIGGAYALADELGFEGEIPVTILFDRNGNELLRVRGAIVRSEFEPKLRSLLSITD